MLKNGDKVYLFTSPNLVGYILGEYDIVEDGYYVEGKNLDDYYPEEALVLIPPEPNWSPWCWLLLLAALVGIFAILRAS